MTLFVVTWRDAYVDARLVSAARDRGVDAAIVTPKEASAQATPGDVVLNRLDVRPTLDGIEPGLGKLRRLGRQGVLVLNGPRALRAAHDKLVTALYLHSNGVPHPETRFMRARSAPAPLAPPLVVKPRFGSWGRDVFRCESEAELAACLRRVRRRPWFRSHGALVQSLIPAPAQDLRVLVAGGRVVGAVERLAAPGEWRTNVSLGGARRPSLPSDGACGLALRAVGALGADLACVDIVTPRDGSPVVLEVNGAPDFTGAYSLDGDDVFDTVVCSLALPAAASAFASA